MSASATKSRREPSRPPHPAAADIRLLNDARLLEHLQFALAIVRARGLDADVRQILGEELLDLQLEAEGRRAAAGEPNMFAALPSVREAADGAA